MPDSNIWSLDWTDVDLWYLAHDDASRSGFAAALTPRNECIDTEVNRSLKRVILCLLDLQYVGQDSIAQVVLWIL